MKQIYLDNAATTKIDPKVIEAMNKSFPIFGNPSSLHSFGQEARKVVDGARDFVAFFLDCKATEVIFTSGGSESDNLAIRGVIDAYYSKLETRNSKLETNNKSEIQNSETGSPIESGMTKGEYGVEKGADGMTTKPHVVTSAIEHHAVLHTIQDLEKEGRVEATYVKPDKKGAIKASDVEAAIKPNTILVSIMYVNNEVGTVQPIREIGKLIEKINLQSIKYQVSSIKGGKEIADKGLKPHDTKYKIRDTENRFSKIYFHTDAVQAAEFFEMGTKYLHVDLLTLTAHKIHGPKGVGVLFIKKGTPIAPQITGGDHEFRLRAGTENVASIAGFAKALEQVSSIKYQVSSNAVIPASHRSTGSTPAGIQGTIGIDSGSPHFAKATRGRQTTGRNDNRVEDDNYIRVKRLRDKLEDSILKNIPDTYLNGDKEKRSPHITNISFKNAEGEAIILNLDFLGIAVSSGSACTSRSLESSHVLTAMDVPHEFSHGAIRFSLSRETTEAEIDRVIEVLPNIIKKLREMSPFK